MSSPKVLFVFVELEVHERAEHLRDRPRAHRAPSPAWGRRRSRAPRRSGSASGTPPRPDRPALAWMSTSARAFAIISSVYGTPIARLALRSAAIASNVERPVEKGIRRHDRGRHHGRRGLEVVAVPLVRILAADAGEVRSGALRAPLERVVVHALGGKREVTVTLDLVAHRANHLAMAEIAALADVDVAAGELERRVGPHALHLLDRALEVEERHDLDEAADRDDDQDADDEEDRVPLEQLVPFPKAGLGGCHGDVPF